MASVLSAYYLTITANKTSPAPPTKPTSVDVYGRVICSDACANNPGEPMCSPCYPFKVTFWAQSITVSSNMSAGGYSVNLPNSRQYAVSLYYFFSQSSDVNAMVEYCMFLNLDSNTTQYGFNVVC